MLRLRFGFVMILAAGSPAAATAQPTYCPGDSVQTYSGTVGDGASATHPIDLQPCEAMTITVTTTAIEPPVYYGAAASLEVFNSSGASIFSRAWSSYPTTTLTLPNGYLYRAPYRGTRGPSGLPSHLVIKSLSRANQYTIVVARSRRPHYNIGGTDAATAPLVSNFPQTIYASIQETESGQYFKVRLASGGRIRVSGTAQTSPEYGANLLARLYRADGTLVSTLVPSIACYDTCSYTSAWYTNTSSNPLEFILRLNAQTWMLWDVVMTIEADEGPRLTLFLDANGDFNAGSPQSDHMAYLPGAELGSGASVALPQSLSLIAAYVDAAGAIVAPPYGVTFVGFALEETSAFRGVAMNNGDSTGADYVLGAATAAFAGDNTARVSLMSNDYGGFTRVRATDGAAAPQFRLPLDTNGNWLPDNGWPVGGGTAADSGGPGDDDDSPGTLNGDAGDGLSSFEEYRGFMVGGLHRRTSPLSKDLFVFSQFTGRGAGDAIGLPLSLHLINDVELDGERRIAHNYTNAGFGGDIPGHFTLFANGVNHEQRAVPVFEDTLTPTGTSTTLAETDIFPNPAPPWAIGPLGIRIYMLRLRHWSPTSNNSNTTDVVDNAKVDQTIAHEIGHAIAIDHFVHPQQGGQPQCPPVAVSVMVTSYFTPTTNGSDCAWSNIPHGYQPADLAQGRLK